MGDEPGTNWERWYKQVLAAKAAAAAEPAPPEFTPTCLDCAYDLTGLDDGVCPECGHGFTRERLLAAYRFRLQQRAKRIRYLWHLPLGIACVPFFTSFGISDYIDLALNAFFFVVGSVTWYAMNRDRFIEGAHWFLVLVIPLLSMAAGIATAERGEYGLIGVLIAIAIVSLLALRGSPLLTSAVLAIGVVVPLTWIAIMMFLDARVTLAAGEYWSDFTYPAFPRWRAFTAAKAQNASVELLGLTVALAIGIIAVAKRSRRRLRRQAELKAARALPP